MSAQLLLWMLQVLSVIAFDDVIEINISTSSYMRSGFDASSVNPIPITFWFNVTMYQFTLFPTKINTTYSTSTFTITHPPDCGPESDHNTSQAKIMVENSDNDVLVLDTFTFTLGSGVWYGINGRCLDDLLVDTQSFLSWTNYYDFLLDESNCGSSQSNIWMCIDDDSADCGPYKQIFYFDLTRPNQFINDALWSDGTNILSQTTSCDPTAHPTENQTHVPTNNPANAIPCDHQNCWSVSGLEMKMNDGSYRSLNGDYMLQGCHNDKAYYLSSSGYYLYWSAKMTNWHIYKTLNEQDASAYCPNTLLLCSSSNEWQVNWSGSWVDAPTADNAVCATIHPSTYPTIDPSNNPTNNPSSNPTINPTTNPTINPTTNPTNFPSNHPTIAPTFVPTEFPSYSPIQHPTTNPTKFLSMTTLAANEDYESTFMTTQLVTHNRRSTTESTMGLVAHTNHDVIQWIVKWMLYVMIALLILLIVCNIICCCCCRKKHKENVQANAMVNIQMGKTHETHQIVPCDEDVECEMVASWMRYTVQLP
eukprot:192202_1